MKRVPLQWKIYKDNDTISPPQTSSQAFEFYLWTPGRDPGLYVKNPWFRREDSRDFIRTMLKEVESISSGVEKKKGFHPL